MNATLQKDLNMEKDRLGKLTEERDALKKRVCDLEAESAETTSTHKIGKLKRS